MRWARVAVGCGLVADEEVDCVGHAVEGVAGERPFQYFLREKKKGGGEKGGVFTDHR